LRSLVVQTSFIGDMVLTTPLIAELARRGPVDVVATPANASLLAGNPDVAEVLVFDKRRSSRGLRGLARMARTIRDRHPDAAYLAQGSMRSAALATLGGCRERVGFSTSSGRALYTTRVRYRGELHHAERLWQLGAGEEARATADQLRPRLYPGGSERELVDSVIAGSPIVDRPFVAVAPGSIWGTKRWPYFAELARAIAPLAPIAVVGGADDGALGRAVSEEVGRGVVDVTGRLPLLASAELIRRAAVLVTNDSAPQHLASAMGTPTVTIFGPTVPEFGFGPLAPRSLSLGHPTLPCRPCHRHGPRECPLGHWRCMRELASAQVSGVVSQLISTSAN
jgi:heptosyltransferase II